MKRASERTMTANRAAGVSPAALLACVLALSVGAMALLAGCGGQAGEDAGKKPALSADVNSFDFDYSDRDKRTTWDEAAAVPIQLNGTTATFPDKPGIAVEDGVLEISVVGTYVLSGEFNGQVRVACGTLDKVQLVLAGARIANAHGPAILIEQCDKAFVTLAPGTRNSLSDNGAKSYDGVETAEDGSSTGPNAVLYSRDDLTINGSGELIVTAAYNHGIFSKNDLVITGGTFDVKAANDCLKGKDSVRICGGAFKLDAGGDGIQASNELEDADGYASIDGGTFDIKAADCGLQAARYARVMGGELRITAGDDGLHCDGDMLVSGGALTISATDNGMRCKGTMNLDGGSITVTAAVKAFSAETVNRGNAEILVAGGIE